MTADPHPKKFRVAEIFGPTIQGEGRRIGTPVHFIRIGGCDYRCSWCDTPHAVLPDQVAKLKQMSEWDIIWELNQLEGSPDWVVVSGGNPALFDLGYLVDLLHIRHQSVMVETQGSVWHDWLLIADDVCISPKPPSAGRSTLPSDTSEFLEKFGNRWDDSYPKPPYLKVVVFDDDDYEYAREQRKANPNHEMFISVGNEDPSLPTVGNPHPKSDVPLGEALMFPNSTKHHHELQTRAIVLEKMKWLMEKVAVDQSMRTVRVLPQLHTLAWGNERGR